LYYGEKKEEEKKKKKFVICGHLRCRGNGALVEILVFRIRPSAIYEGWNFNSGNYLFTTDTK